MSNDQPSASRTPEERIFEHAAGLTEPEERAAYLRQACAGDVVLRGKVDQLLEASLEAERIKFLPAENRSTLPAEALPEKAGGRIGRYKLLEQIGEGGFGVVFMAEQDEPIRRRAALKVIKLGMDTRQVIARFEAERQALAMMDHPNIAKVLDAGATETGRPFFVMELVKGIPITEFCDKNKLPIEDRLKLFISVCQAIQHAHQKGIIHRDIKPSNILVTLEHGEPLAKVIDFGVAKAINQRLTEKTLFTQFSQLIGTPAYMSPEQAEMSTLDIDTRTDIYSLGVLLYELVTGTTPITPEQLRQVSYGEMQRLIREEEAIRPSTRLSTMDAGKLSVTARNRSSEASLLSRIVRSDLDWVVMKSLEKDRRRRYETPTELAADLRRHLNNEPVAAKPPNLGYKLRKFARRNRATVAAGLSIAAILVAGIVASTSQAVRATRAERAKEALLLSEQAARTFAEQERARADRQSELARAEAAEAKRQTQISEAVLQFLTKDILGAGDAWMGAPTPDLTLRTVLERAQANLEAGTVSEPLVEASARLILYTTIGSNTHYQERLKNLRRALDLLAKERGENHTDTLKAKFYIAQTLIASGQGAEVDQGFRTMEEVFQARLEHFGEAHPETIGVMNLYGQFHLNRRDVPKALPLIERASRLAMEKLGPDHIETLNATYHLGALRSEQGRLLEYERLMRRHLEAVEKRFGQRHIRHANMLGELANLRYVQGDYPAAVELAERGLKVSRELEGNKYPTTFLLQLKCAALMREGRFAEASVAAREVIGAFKENFGPDHSYTRVAVRRSVSIPARLGLWHAALEESRKWRAENVTDGHLLAWELLLEHLLGRIEMQPEMAERIGRPLLDDFDGRHAYQVALTLAVLPPRGDLSNLRRIVTERFLAATNSLEMSWYWLRPRIVQGIVAYREDRFAESAQILQPLADNLDNRRIAVLARYFQAMARFKLGHAEEARRILNSANTLFSSLLRAGDLELAMPPYERWSTHGCSLSARDEAERLIHGGIVSPEVTERFLTENRESWRPVGLELGEVHRLARQRKFADARNTFLRMQSNPVFSLEAALETDERWLVESVPLLFAMTGDRLGFQQLLEELIGDQVLAINHVVPVGYAGWELPGNLREKIEKGLQGLEVPSLSGRELSNMHRLWSARHIALGLLRVGREEEALKLLRASAEHYHHPCAVSSQAFAAVAAGKLGRIDEAREWLAKAEAGLSQSLDPATGNYDYVWWHYAASQLAIEEARRLLNPKVAAKPKRQP